ncbi:MAG: thioredoxin [Myxococcota bacterium]
MHSTIDVTEKNFENLISGEGIVLLDWWAEWCGPCRMFAPIYEKAAEKHPDITWGKVNTETERGLAQALGIRSIPTLMVFRDGILVFAQPGMVPAQALESLVEQVRNLDMDEVRKEVGEQEAQRSAQQGQ